MNKGFRVALVLATMSIGFMDPASAAEGWTSGNLKFVYPLSDGSFVITLKVDPSNCPATSSPKYLYVTAGSNGVTTDGVKAMLATSLTALVAGKQIQIAFDDSSVSCYVNRLVILD